MKTNSKNLGNQYERQVVKELSAWLTGNSDDDLVCWRNVHSGSVATIRKKKGLIGETTSGDFQCLDSTYQNFFKLFNCDSKSLGNVFMYIHKGNVKSNQLFQEWVKVCDDSENSKKIPMMFVKARNERKIPDFIVLHEKCDIVFTNVIRYNINYNILESNSESDSITPFKFKIIIQEEFFELNEWKSLVESNKKVYYKNKDLICNNDYHKDCDNCNNNKNNNNNNNKETKICLD